MTAKASVRLWLGCCLRWLVSEIAGDCEGWCLTLVGMVSEMAGVCDS
jgi:hypothetical protein